jgi:hypothetical protein
LAGEQSPVALPDGPLDPRRRRELLRLSRGPVDFALVRRDSARQRGVQPSIGAVTGVPGRKVAERPDADREWEREYEEVRREA